MTLVNINSVICTGEFEPGSTVSLLGDNTNLIYIKNTDTNKLVVHNLFLELPRLINTLSIGYNSVMYNLHNIKTIIFQRIRT